MYIRTTITLESGDSAPTYYPNSYLFGGYAGNIVNDDEHTIKEFDALEYTNDRILPKQSAYLATIGNSFTFHSPSYSPHMIVISRQNIPESLELYFVALVSPSIGESKVIRFMKYNDAVDPTIYASITIDATNQDIIITANANYLSVSVISPFYILP